MSSQKETSFLQIPKGRRDKGLCVEPISLLKLTLASRLPQNHKYLLDLSKFIPALSSHLFYPHSPASHSPCNSAISAVVSLCLLLHLLCWLMHCPSVSIFCLCRPRDRRPPSPQACLFCLSLSLFLYPSPALPPNSFVPLSLFCTLFLLLSWPYSVCSIFFLFWMFPDASVCSLISTVEILPLSRPQSSHAVSLYESQGSNSGYRA